MSKIVPILTPESQHLFAEFEGKPINEHYFQPEGMEGIVSLRTAALRPSKPMNLFGITNSEHLGHAGIQDATDHVATATVTNLYLLRDGELKTLEVNLELKPRSDEDLRMISASCKVDGEEKDFFIDIDTQTITLRSSAKPYILGFDLVIGRENANRQSVADIIHSTPAQATDSPPEVGSASYDDRELATAIGIESTLSVVITRFPAGLEKLADQELAKKLKKQIDELFFSAIDTDNIFVGIDVEVDDDKNVVGLSRSWKEGWVEFTFNGGTNAEVVLTNWMTQLMMDPETKNWPKTTEEGPAVPDKSFYTLDVVCIQAVGDKVLSAVEVTDVMPTSTYGRSGLNYNFTGKQTITEKTRQWAHDLLNRPAEQ